jgi:hypothetical protein
MTTEVLGRSVQGRDLLGVLVNATETPEQRRDFRRPRATDRGISARAVASLVAIGNFAHRTSGIRSRRHEA